MQPLSLLAPQGQTKIYLYAKHVDLRKSFDGLHALIQSEFQRDVRLGDLFLFLNRRLDRIKLRHWDRDGLVIVDKRLERGTFQRPHCPVDADHLCMDATDLTLLLSGIELTSVKRRRRYSVESAALASLEPSRSGRTLREPAGKLFPEIFSLSPHPLWRCWRISLSYVPGASRTAFPAKGQAAQRSFQRKRPPFCSQRPPSRPRGERSRNSPSKGRSFASC